MNCSKLTVFDVTAFTLSVYMCELEGSESEGSTLVRVTLGRDLELFLVEDIFPCE